MRDSIALYFRDAKSWSRLPTWAEFFFTMGRSLACGPEGDARTVFALLVPARSYCAALIGAGMALGDAASRAVVPKSSNFDRLWNLPPGTPVIYSIDSRQQRGFLMGREILEGQRFVRVQLQKKSAGGYTHLVPERNAAKIRLVEDVEDGEWELPEKLKKGELKSPNAFIEGLFGDNDPICMGLSSRHLVKFVGRRNILEHEVKKTRLAIREDKSQYHPGNFQDILRIAELLPPNQPFRSTLETDAKPASSETETGIAEIGVIFDGAPGYLKWSARWRSRNQIVIIDRTETQCDAAVSAINSRFVQRNRDGSGTIPEGQVPPGVELLAFQEAI